MNRRQTLATLIAGLFVGSAARAAAKPEQSIDRIEYDRSMRMELCFHTLTLYGFTAEIGRTGNHIEEPERKFFANIKASSESALVGVGVWGYGKHPLEALHDAMFQIRTPGRTDPSMERYHEKRREDQERIAEHFRLLRQYPYT